MLLRNPSWNGVFFNLKQNLLVSTVKNCKRIFKHRNNTLDYNVLIQLNEGMFYENHFYRIISVQNEEN